MREEFGRNPMQWQCQSGPTGAQRAAHTSSLGTVGNVEVVTRSITQQGTHIDALGHFGYLAEPWDRQTAFPADRVAYYG
jgi:hypothetical protein